VTFRFIRKYDPASSPIYVDFLSATHTISGKERIITVNDKEKILKKIAKKILTDYGYGFSLLKMVLRPCNSSTRNQINTIWLLSI
jgi:hypothetical protein